MWAEVLYPDLKIFRSSASNCPRQSPLFGSLDPARKLTTTDIASVQHAGQLMGSLVKWESQLLSREENCQQPETQLEIRKRQFDPFLKAIQNGLVDQIRVVCLRH